MFSYEADNSSYLLGLKNIIIALAILFKQLFMQKTRVYYYSNGSDHIFLNEFSYLNKLKILEKVAGETPDFLSLEKVEVLEESSLIFKYQHQPIKLISIIIKEGKNDNRSFLSILAVIRSSLKYSFVFDKKFISQQQGILKKYQNAIISDPGNPFTKSLSGLNKIDTKYVCTTAIFKHSTEWHALNSNQIYVVGSQQIANDFLKYHRKTINFIPSKTQSFLSSKYQYRILFFHQYYHRLAFKNRFLHFIHNYNIAKKRGVLTRLHPNEAIFEKIIYQILSFFGLIMISKENFSANCASCRYAVSFSSSALLEFKIQTGRKAR